VTIQGLDLNGFVGVADAEDFSWNPFESHHYEVEVAEDGTVELNLRLEWFKSAEDLEEGVRTGVFRAVRELNLGYVVQYSFVEDIVHAIFEVQRANENVHQTSRIHFKFATVIEMGITHCA
jgi:hypothetical protein